MGGIVGKNREPQQSKRDYRISDWMANINALPIPSDCDVLPDSSAAVAQRRRCGRKANLVLDVGHIAHLYSVVAGGCSDWPVRARMDLAFEAGAGSGSYPCTSTNPPCAEYRSGDHLHVWFERLRKALIGRGALAYLVPALLGCALLVEQLNYMPTHLISRSSEARKFSGSLHLPGSVPPSTFPTGVIIALVITLSRPTA